MIFQRDLLQQKKQHEIRSLLVQHGASWHPTEKKSDLIDRLIMITMATQPDSKLKKHEKVEPMPVKYPTKDEVLEATELHRSMGMKVNFSNDDTLWHFYIQKGTRKDHNAVSDINLSQEAPVQIWGKEDSGTMKQPLGIIVRCADMLVRV